MDEQKRTLWMPVRKNAKGEYEGILSDTSIDRDEECMSKSLIRQWAKNKSLPALANHENKMQAWVGGWKDFKVIEKGDHAALYAKPMFFSKEANPLAAQIEKQVEEALEMGLNPGISIGAIPHEFDNVEINGEIKRQWTDAELLEATWVPIQSNRNATFGHIAKSFDYMEGKNMVDKPDNKKASDSELEKLKEELAEKTAMIEQLNGQIAEMQKDSEEKAEKESKEKEEKDAVLDEMKNLKAEIEEMKKQFDEKLEKAVKEHTVKLPEGPGYMDAEHKEQKEKTEKAKDTPEGVVMSFLK